MLYIEKKPCPAHIQEEIDETIDTNQWRSLPEVPVEGQTQIMREQYFNKLTKHNIRAALIDEQHGLCAYCMDRIVNHGKKTTIEHWYPLSKSKAGAMDYRNWLGVCKGGSNIRLPSGKKRVLCCDAKKENAVTVISPLNRAQMDAIAYYDDGTIFYQAFGDGNQAQITRELNTIFALNGKIDPRTGRSQRDTTSGIVKKRKDTYIAMYEQLEQMYLSGALTPDIIHRYRQDLLSDPEWEPFVGVKLYVLQMFEEFLTNP